MASSTKKKNKKLPEILLVFSVLLLGGLIVLLVYKTRHTEVISGSGQSGTRELTNGYPTPSQLVDSDLEKYFSYMDVPDLIFDRMQGVSYTEGCPVGREDLSYVNVLYWGTDNEPHKGELVVNKAIAGDVSYIFFKLYQASYPIESVKLIDEYGGNDEVSMANNNTSCFNGRRATGSDSWSMHAYGLAIDINPLYNPYVGQDGTILPVAAEKYADRSENFVMKIDETDYAYSLFISRGFGWGGNWENLKDYQHFEKNL